MGTKYWNIRSEETTEAGAHFGHQARRWNPKMAPHTPTERKGIHTIDPTQTARSSPEARDPAAGAAGTGKQFPIAGTKYQTADVIRSAAIRAQRHYANEKWLGGMPTNWSTMETRPQRLEDSEGKAARLHHGYPDRSAATSGRQSAQPRRYPVGTRYMKGLPDIATTVDQREELTAIRECTAPGIPTTRLADTDCDPDMTDIPIPANDDPRAPTRRIPNKPTPAIREGRH
uniref:Small ribosomal subunit protein uS2c n=1 Tax=Selaginella doederleinii TaxID=186426 RepID=A0A482CGZ8_9TRAC|nr:ribosomal protein S2 [Selaginella doederleinii]QBL76013.1 ribosomal protein S2 [Selaginella doederleinii]